MVSFLYLKQSNIKNIDSYKHNDTPIPSHKKKLIARNSMFLITTHKGKKEPKDSKEEKQPSPQVQDLSTPEKQPSPLRLRESVNRSRKRKSSKKTDQPELRASGKIPLSPPDTDTPTRKRIKSKSKSKKKDDYAKKGMDKRTDE